jgi:uncharacterized protein
MNRVGRVGLGPIISSFAMATLVLLGSVTPVAAGPIEDAIAAHEREDYAAALRLYRPLAAEGDTRAQMNMALMYRLGQGVARNAGEAMKWYRLAAAQGDPRAQFSIGDMYDEGEGVAQNFGEAMKWYRLAAAKGEPRAQFALGLMYSQGAGVPQDHTHAHMWFSLAAEQFSPSASREARGRAARNRDLAARKMTPAQIAESYRLAREWKPNG